MYEGSKLHQPRAMYNVGGISWGNLFLKPKDYLATKEEVLDYYESVVAQCTRKFKVIFMGGYHFDFDEQLIGSKIVFTATRVPTVEEPVLKIHLDKVKVKVDRLIKALGFYVKILPPLKVSSTETSHCVSMAPNDQRLNEHMLMRSNPGVYTPPPIYIIGSGKTAMDMVSVFQNEGTKERRNEELN